jgi:endonuclease/exonuclease/phosphatase family metal-dependent hydrolase
MKKIISKTIWIVSLLAGLGLIITSYAGWLNPNTWSWLSLAGYAFPLFLLLTMACLVICALIRKRYLLVPFFALIAAYPAVSLYFPLHFAALGDPVTSDSTLTVISYNTYNWSWGEGVKDKNETPNRVVEFLAALDVDVMCLQESPLTGYSTNELNRQVTKKLQYTDTIHGHGSSTLTLISRFPIVRKQFIDYDTKGNISGAFWLNVRGREVIILSNHLQTMGFTMGEREDFSSMVHGEKESRNEIKNTSHTIAGKILSASKIRANQAEALAAFIRDHKNEPLIVCGDFNDIPQSYTYHTISSALDDEADALTDCYRAVAAGPGFTYSRYGIRARIDHMFCSSHLEPIRCRVDRTTDASDHYPIICQMIFR